MVRLVKILFVLMVSCQHKHHIQSIPERFVSKRDTHFRRSLNGHLNYDSLPFSGFVMTYYPNGAIQSKKAYYEGIQQQVSYTYYPDGQKETVRPYLNGEKHGEHLGYHADGQPKFKYIFQNGFSEGTHYTWYPSGSLESEMNFKDGHEFGSQKVWRPDGKYRSNYVIRENGRRYGMLGIKRCQKIDSETGDMDPYLGESK